MSTVVCKVDETEEGRMLREAVLDCCRIRQVGVDRYFVEAKDGEVLGVLGRDSIGNLQVICETHPIVYSVFSWFTRCGFFVP